MARLNDATPSEWNAARDMIKKNQDAIYQEREATKQKTGLEAWMPGRGSTGEWGEVTSTSNCTDYQARRLAIRFRNPNGKGTQFVHTLNGTAVAISRAIVAILENYQQEDGSVKVPEALVSWMGKNTMTVSRG